MRKDNRKWNDGFNESIVASIFFAFLTFCISAAISKSMWIGIFIGLAILILSFTVFLKNHRESIYKFFLTDGETANQIVANVLEAKGIPYERDKHHFYLNALTIIVGKARSNYLTGAIVVIRPYKAIHYPLIKSLQGKIDEAFMPKGASTKAL